jgi:hypothetical protein
MDLNDEVHNENRQYCVCLKTTIKVDKEMTSMVNCLQRIKSP